VEKEVYWLGVYVTVARIAVRFWRFQISFLFVGLVLYGLNNHDDLIVGLLHVRGT
jgi:hypothetical protein